jgi:hypothetical protein
LHTPPAVLLLTVLRQPTRLAQLSLAEFDLLLRQADCANLLATLYYLAEEAGVLAAMPDGPREQLLWAQVLAERHNQAVYWEVRLIEKALAGLGLPLLLLKGGAYATAGLAPARGRLFSDIDILVPLAKLPEVEAALMMAGWITTQHDAYDQRYYREWMHELPPMRHVQRASVIDVHHAILPRTAACHPDSALLLAAAQAIPGQPGLQVLAPADMVLHSATHLFSDGEFDKGLRDLWDLHCLLCHFGSLPGFWDGLPARARQLELDRFLYYALRHAAALLGTPVPGAVTAALAASAPPRHQRWLMEALLARALLPDHASCRTASSALARFALYVRGNWLRMPPWRLARHLFHKAFLTPRKPRETAA